LYYQKHESNIDETPYNIKVNYSSKTETFSGSIKGTGNSIHICTFTLGDLENNSSAVISSPINSEQSKLEQERDRLQQELNRVNNELNRIKNTR
jgi:gas vesicle protein